MFNDQSGKMIQEITGMTVDQLKVKIYENRNKMGADAAHDVSEKIKSILTTQGSINIIFAAAPSQNEFLQALVSKEVDWSKVNAFHMDEYVGLDIQAPQSFAHFLKNRIFDKVPFHEVHYLNGKADDPYAECQRYAELLKQFPADIVCMGIGENTHLAFNDPHVADFNDPQMVKVVDLDIASRLQQVHDDCFDRIEDVPFSAITLTVPTLVQAEALFCIVPGSNKAQAVYHTLHSEVKDAYPSTVLRKHNHAILYLDKDSAAKL